MSLLIDVIGIERVSDLPRDQRHLAKAALNDPAYTARAAADHPHSEAELGSFGAFVTDRLTDTTNIGNNSLHPIKVKVSL